MKPLNKNYPYYENKDIKNIKEMLDYTRIEYTDRVAFSYYGNNRELIKKNYNDVYNDVKYFSAYLNKKYNNKHIALVGENSYNWIITFLAIILSGNLVVVVDKDYSEDELFKLFKKSDVNLVFYSESYLPSLRKSKYKSYPIDSIKNYLESGKNCENKYKTDSLKEAVIFFTSGTTGPNKGVVLSQSNLAADIYGASSLFKPGGKTVSILPYHHTFGFVTAVLKPFYYGVETFINKSLKTVLNDFQEIKPDTIFVVPLFVETFYKQIWKGARRQKKDKMLETSLNISNGLFKMGIDMRKILFKSVVASFGGNLRYIICGGAYLDKKYVEWFRGIGIEILNGYGITECSPVVSVNRNHFYRDGSIGQPCRGIDVKIINDEICVKGPIVMKGYYKDKKATSEVVYDGYFHTGDLGYIDDDGFIYITGRKKNIIILSNGENISPEVIEESLINDKGVCEALVYEKDNRLIAVIYPNDGYLGDQEYFDSLIYKINKDKPKNHQIAMVELRMTEFPKNNNKKIIRSKVIGEENEK